MSRKLIPLFSLACFFLLCGNSLHAQQEPGQFTLAFGFNGTDQPRHPEAGAAKLRTPVNFRLKILDRLLVGADYDAFLTKRPVDGEWSNGTGNVVLLVRPELFSEEVETWQPTVRLTYSITLPTASVAKGLGTGRVDHKIFVNFKKTVSADDAKKQTVLGLDVGRLFSGRQGTSGFKKTDLLNVYLERDLDDEGNYNLHIEIDTVRRAETTPSQIYSTNWIKAKLNSCISINGGFVVGITPTAPRIGGFGGITYTGRLWK